ncbi:hypothetical protein GCM10017771_35900 [Streptomyces capitiformicae]|uniref:Uncharacterized protein n=1 Tax=Streptomyces capitiformicae TaxID=2014920 RepID=A0A919GQA7_9ACTN|nr:hypothetical protein GCM10017771_35900 [Streptomyces capitiformicae]
MQQVVRPFMPTVADSGADLPAASGALQAQLAHEPGDGATGRGYALAVQLPPDLPDPVDAVVVGMDPADVRFQLRDAHRPALGVRFLAA